MTQEPQCAADILSKTTWMLSTQRMMGEQLTAIRASCDRSVHNWEGKKVRIYRIKVLAADILIVAKKKIFVSLAIT
jgi:hypothetical protein